MNRCYLFLCCLTISAMSIGCCGPIGCGAAGGCGDCDGVCYGQQVIPAGPLDSLHQMRKNLVCGSGCGGVYRGEWISTPPDCQDPCCGTEFVGGATPCRPFCLQPCWQPGMLLRHLYGSRFCDSGVSQPSCGCGLASCDGDCEGEMMTTIDDGEFSQMDSPAGSDCGCGTPHTATRSPMISQRTMPASDPMTRSAQMKTRSQRVIR